MTRIIPPAKQDEAFKLIDEFGQALLKLSNGQVIPSHWKIRILKAIEPMPGVAGRPADAGKTAKIVELLLDDPEASAEQTKHKSPARAKARIADAVGVARKTVDRRQKQLRSIGDPSVNAPPEIVEGVAAYISKRIDARHESDFNKTTRDRFKKSGLAAPKAPKAKKKAGT
jgi:hypothetical protein